jgi:hypothetical protein
MMLPWGKNRGPTALSSAPEMTKVPHLSHAGLFGTAESCLVRAAAGAHRHRQIARLVDFGIDSDRVLDGLNNLLDLKGRVEQIGARGGNSGERLPLTA